MKVVLIKDLKGKGKSGDIIEVNDGYARNFLIPNNIAIIGNASNLNEAKQAKASHDYQESVAKEKARKIANELKGKTITIAIKSGQNGKIFGSVTNKEIASQLEKQGYDIDKKKIEVQNIKTLGKYSAKIKLFAAISVEITIDVVAE